MVRIGDGGGGVVVGGGEEKPAWLQGLMEETFFAGCGAHERRRKNEKNIFCLLCCLSFCPHCLPAHRSHPLLQVRRYVYHDVVRLVDLQRLIDCSFIQPYTINGAKVIFLKQRTQSSRVQSGRGWKAGTPNVCFTCDRILQPPFHFCSLSCKVEHMVCQGEGLTSICMSSASQLEGLRVDNSGLLEDEDDEEEEEEEDDQMTPNYSNMANEPFASEPHYYSSHDQGNGVGESSMVRYPSSSSTTTVVNNGGMFTKRKKKGNASATTTATSTSGGGSGGSGSGKSRFLSVFSINSRRKGAPHRAPLS